MKQLKFSKTRKQRPYVFYEITSETLIFVSRWNRISFIKAH